MPEHHSLVAFHGFTQTGRMFDELGALLGVGIHAPTLPGRTTSALDDTRSMLRSVGPRPVLGYSMGGRIALRLALQSPDLVTSLILVSTMPGIADSAERAARRETDAALSARIARVGVAAFVDEWLQMPLFHGLRSRGEDWRSLDRSLRLQNTAHDLSRCLERFGQGAMEYVGDRLPELAMPVTVIVGEADRKYVAIGQAMAAEIVGAGFVTVPGAGHSVIGEAPDAVAAVVESML